ncbi:MAG: hypothetical protein WCR67_00175 [Bacilli bacterium]
MKKKPQILFSIIALLAGCSSSVPEDIRSFVSSMNLDNCLTEIKTISAEYTSSLYNYSDESTVYGTLSLEIKVDRTDTDDYYSKVKDIFTGELSVFDEESNLYLADATAYCYFSEEDSSFVYEVTKHGYDSESLEGPLCVYNNKTVLSAIELLDHSTKAFYRTESYSVVSDGLYYGDFLSTRLKYYQFMSLKDDTLVYSIYHQLFKTDTEEGYTDEEITIDKSGMLLSLSSLACNLTTNKESLSKGKAIYNSVIERDK